MAAVQTTQIELSQRKAAVQSAVRSSREITVRQRRAVVRGNFGSSEMRVTNPVTRRLALGPEDARA